MQPEHHRIYIKGKFPFPIPADTPKKTLIELKELFALLGNHPAFKMEGDIFILTKDLFPNLLAQKEALESLDRLNII